jgi:uncharacterized cupredoxin-like copper-binding protein
MSVKTFTTFLVTTSLVGMLSACDTNKNTDQPPVASSPATKNSPVASSPATTTSPASSPTTQPGKATQIQVTEKDMAILLSSPSAPAGPVDFVTKYIGPSPHEFLVVKTDFPVDKLPLKGGRLDEKAKGIEVIDEIEVKDLPNGANKTLRVNLRPGKYLLVCNIPSHFRAGMLTPFTAL